MKQKPKHSSPHHTITLLSACHVMIQNGPFEPDCYGNTRHIGDGNRRIRSRPLLSTYTVVWSHLGLYETWHNGIYIYNPRAQKAEAGKPAQIESQAGLHGEFKTRPDCSVRLSQTDVCGRGDQLLLAALPEDLEEVWFPALKQGGSQLL